MWASPVGNSLHVFSYTIAGKLNVSMWFYWQDSWKLVPGLSWTLFNEPVPFADFNLYSFVIIKYNREYNSFLSAVDSF